MIANTLPAKADILQRNNVTLSGKGTQPLLFAHGFGTDQGVWRLVAPEFEDRFRVVRFDFVGSGRASPRADAPDRYDSLHGYKLDVLEICAALELEDVIFVAHSVAGMIGILASVECPQQFERLVLVASSARYLNEHPSYVGGFDRGEVDDLLRLMEENFLGWARTFAGVTAKEPALSRELFEKFSSNEPRAARRFAEVTFHADVRSELPRVTVPSLLLQCAHDDIVPASASDYLARHLPGSRRLVLPIAGHCPQVSAPQLIVEAMSEYLAKPARTATA